MAGVRDGDTITAIEGRPVTNRDSLFRELSRYQANAQVGISVLRYAAVLRNPIRWRCRRPSAKNTLRLEGQPIRSSQSQLGVECESNIAQPYLPK